jgi:glycosyltransferase involved in cell wall biosynthesis
MPKVSVIIPTYNRKDMVTETIESVLNQTMRDFEVVVVDDGSVDNTGEVLMSRFGGRINYIYQTNRGRCVARNRGLLESTGRYVVFLDSDDLLLPGSLEAQSQYLDMHPSTGVIYSDGYYCDEFGRNLERISETRPPLRGKDMLETLVLSNVIIAPHSAMVRRSCFDALGYPFFDESLSVGEDTEFWIRLARSGCIFEYHDVLTCKYRIHGDNTYAPDRYDKDVRSFVESLFKIYNSEYFHELSPEIQRDFFHLYLLRYLAKDPDSQQKLLDSQTFALMPVENRAMASYFIGVKNIIEDGLVALGRQRLREAVATDGRWKYRLVFCSSYLGQFVLRQAIRFRRRLGVAVQKRAPVSPVHERLLEYSRQNSDNF